VSDGRLYNYYNMVARNADVSRAGSSETKSFSDGNRQHGPYTFGGSLASTCVMLNEDKVTQYYMTINNN